MSLEPDMDGLMLDKWSSVTKLSAGDAIAIGISQVTPLISRNSGAGVAIGFSMIEAGSINVDVGKPELFIILEGSMTVSIGDETQSVSENELIWLPANSIATVTTLAPCRVLYAIIGDAE